mmetsp:Transcript_40793/g.49494  ORF Transcript_40793/g.49494 Transcript_40793/m.49494 type:complete len:544 (-) Transcript_40793:39-1670(-)|eukprot:CAMPEP_0197849104 /NCGR_PEP_ID=MMETSP1438-20131217/10909_1 /TAXON_ID=1461541 /ORGANISM="Pterosperma sp., Strain CCMP1384" /LENGTH=543 /DNA_ID=CAMNT_0043461637 /DNA_START=131 /DNA_END=1762 /DNA_ORIENTATION=+
MDVIASALKNQSSVAVTSTGGDYTYADLLHEGSILAKQLTAVAKEKGLEVPQEDNWFSKLLNGIMGAIGGGGAPSETPKGPRVAVMADAGPEYVASMWAAWMSGGVAVPMALANPPPELLYTLKDAGCTSVLATAAYCDKLQPLADEVGAKLIKVEAIQPGTGKDLKESEVVGLGPMTAGAGALIIYTSGTTGRPKGALHTHSGLKAQMESLSQAWKWEKKDRMVHCLPLHHIHGIVNGMMCCHLNGAALEMMVKFSPTTLWKRVQNFTAPSVTIFMGVPTMYAFLISAYDKMTEDEQKVAGSAMSKLRLQISGSAACPVPIMNKWREITGGTLLERYGMTEIGMGLSNPYDPMDKRRPGFVGTPLPGQEIKVVPEDGSPEEHKQNGPGELRIKGPLLFAEYIGRPEATKEAFDEEGYFKTGDMVQKEDGMWRILGRSSVDIIKNGGYKLSALEIENHLLEHPGIGECAVCGVADEAYGELVGVILTGKDDKPALELKELQDWAKDHMATYKIPKLLLAVDKIPRNAMGKVNKKELVKLFDKK